MKKLQERFTQIDSITSNFLKSKGVFGDIDKHKLFQIKFSHFVISKYLNDDNFISSRFISDLYAYSKEDFNKTKDKSFKITVEDTLNMAQVFKDDLIIYIPIKIKLEGTELRSSDSVFQKTIDKNIKEFLRKTGLKYYTLKSLAVDDRVDEVLDIVRSHYGVEL